MTTIQLEAHLRSAGKARRLRREGLVPAVVYGRGGEPEHIALPAAQVDRLLTAGTRGMVQLVVAGDQGDARTVMVRDVQQDPIRGDVIHMDFLRVSLTDKVQTTVPVALTGDDALPGTVVLQQLLYAVDVQGLPQDLPEAIAVDVSAMAAGDNLLVADLVLPTGITVSNDPEQVVVQVTERRAIPEPDTAADDTEADGAAVAGDQAQDADSEG